jgi:hypothetical protein
MSWEPLAEDRFPERFEAELSCRMRDGVVHEVRVDDVFGNRSRPTAPAAVREKFHANARRSLTDEGRMALEAAVDGFDQATDLTALSAAIRMGRTEHGDTL